MIDDPLFKPGDQKVFAPDGDISSAARRFDIAWLVLLSIVVLTGVGALCFGWWLPAAVLLIGGGIPVAAILRRILAERAMVRRMRNRSRNL
jgi:CHASE2 domain-containing sensor protein